jgi:hypothetical protein
MIRFKTFPRAHAIKLGHCHFQIRPLGVELGQYPISHGWLWRHESGTYVKFTQAEYQPSAIHFETDSEGLKTRRRPNRFTLERRVGIPFGGNLFYSQAPMKSADHLSLLGALEGLAD